SCFETSRLINAGSFPARAVTRKSGAHQQREHVMAVTTISKPLFVASGTTVAVTLGAGDILDLLSTGSIVDEGSGVSYAILGAGGNSLTLDGEVGSLNDAIHLSGGNNDINLAASCSVIGGSGFDGIAIANGGNHLGLAGSVSGTIPINING